MTRNPWPGNVRELGNAIERALVMSRRGPIGVEHLVLDPPGLFSEAQAPRADREETAGASIHTIERQAILDALVACSGNRTHAARRLGISVRTLRNRLRDYRDEGLFVVPPRAFERMGELG